MNPRKVVGRPWPLGGHGASCLVSVNERAWYSCPRRQGSSQMTGLGFSGDKNVSEGVGDRRELMAYSRSRMS